jgi:DNA-binding NtrC family response regulator
MEKVDTTWITLVEFTSRFCWNGVLFNIGTPHAVQILMKRNMSSDGPTVQDDKPLVLVVDDEHAMRQLVTDTLSAGGFSCVTAASVGEAITALNNGRFKLMVLDWGLDRCGSEVLRGAKKLYPQMPVLVMSGQNCDVLTDAILEEADAFLPKPFSCIVLNKQVAQLIKRDTFLPARPEDILPLKEVKRVYIQHVVALLNNNASLAAEKLQIHRQTVSAALARPDAPAGDSPGVQRTN